MKKLTFILLTTMLCTISSSIFAASPQPKDSVEYNERYKAAVIEMIGASGGVSTMDASLTKIFDMMGASMPQEQKNAFAEIKQMILTDFFNDLIIQMIPIYKKHITLEDMEYFAEMYKTPQGKRLKEAMPKIAVEAAEMALKLGMELQGKIAEIMQRNAVK